MLNVIKELCKLHAGSYGIERTSSVPRFQSKRPARGGFVGPPPVTFGRGGYYRGYGGYGGGYKRGFRGGYGGGFRRRGGF